MMYVCFTDDLPTDASDGYQVNRYRPVGAIYA